MIFLKKIEAEGFKSYAQAICINLNEPFIGIVGSNGSGKTNVVDAIKWVLGESSAKQLRSDTNNDIIFYGSDAFAAAEFSSVALYFDNTKRLLKIDEDEVVVKRVLRKNSESSEYYLNNKLSKRKEIIDLFLDTGLSKGSLGIISQGTVQEFVDAKPIERRQIFEEAAGISKYIKIKQERENELAKVENTLLDLQKTNQQYVNNINKLKRQAENAQKYLDLKNQLKEYAIFDAKKKYLYYQNKVSELNDTLQKEQTQLNQLQQQAQTNKIEANQKIEQQKTQDAKYGELNQQLIHVLEKISQLNQEKSVYEANLKNQLFSVDKNQRIAALKQNISNLSFQADNWKKDAQKRFDQQQELIQQRDQINQEITQIQKTIENYKNDYFYLKNNLSNVEFQIANEFKNEHGLKTILENKNVVPGLINVLSKLIKVKDAKYALAIELALNKNINTLVVNSVNDAKLGIEFLKQNKAGIASFMPLDALSNSDISKDVLTIAKNFQGFINSADQLVEIDDLYYPVVKNLIGKVLIVSNLDQANLLAKAINHALKIITLDGNIIYRGGMIVGGSQVQKVAKFNLEEEKNKINKALNLLDEKLKQLEINLKKQQQEQEIIKQKINGLSLNQISVKEKIKNIEDEINKNKLDLKALDYETKDLNQKEDEINTTIKDLALLEQQKTEISNALVLQKDICNQLQQQYIQANAELNNLNEQIFLLQTKTNKNNNDLVLSKNLIQKSIDTVNEYQLSMQTVLEQTQFSQEIVNKSEQDINQTIVQLKTQIQSFGTINLQSIEELALNEQKQAQLQKNLDDIVQSQTNLNKAIHEIDKEVTRLFKNKIEQINEKLPEAFSKLFKDGKCYLKFTDPDDLLNTGIEVVVKPANKQIRKLNVLSGGEKAIISLSILLTVLKTTNFPLVILDEAESALDPRNAELLADLIKQNSDLSQFIVITHRKETMVKCDKLLGASMTKGVTSVYNVSLKEIK